MTSPAAPDPLELAQAQARAYLAGLAARPVAPTAEALAGLAHFDRELQVESCAAEEVLSELDRWGSPATVATQGGRYFGFVVGGSLPVATGAISLATAWDQNVALRVLSPAAVELEDVALGWIVSLLGLPVGTGGAFVTTATAATLTALRRPTGLVAAAGLGISTARDFSALRRCAWSYRLKSIRRYSRGSRPRTRQRARGASASGRPRQDSS
jgi:hypothetical protein